MPYPYYINQTDNSDHFQGPYKQTQSDLSSSGSTFDSQPENGSSLFSSEFEKGDRVRRINSENQNPLMVHSKWYDDDKGCWMYRCGCGYVIQEGNLAKA